MLAWSLLWFMACHHQADGSHPQRRDRQSSCSRFAFRAGLVTLRQNLFVAAMEASAPTGQPVQQAMRASHVWRGRRIAPAHEVRQRPFHTLRERTPNPSFP
jgi:hypothetical protein